MDILNKIKNTINIKFVKDSGFTIGSHFLVGISGLLINTIIGNMFDVDGLGVINQGLSIYMLLALISNFGIQTSVQKHTSQHISDKNLVKTIFTTAVIATLISSFLFVVLFLLLILVFPNIISSQRLIEIVNILIYGVPLLALNKTVNNFMTGLREMKVYSLVRLIRWFSIIVLLILIQLLELPLNTIAYSFVFSEILILIYFTVKTKKFWGKGNIIWITNHLTFGLKSILAEFVSTFSTRIPILLVGYILGDTMAGYYSYIEVFAYSILMISSALQKNFNPVFTMLWHSNDFDEIKSRVKKVFKILSYLLLPMLIGMGVLYYGYTTVLMDESYLIYSDVLLTLMFGVSIRFLFGPFFTFLIMANFLYANLFRVAINALVNIILVVLLLKPMGLIGVSIAFGISMLIDVLLLNYLYKRKLNLNLFKIISTSFKV